MILGPATYIDVFITRKVQFMCEYLYDLICPFAGQYRIQRRLRCKMKCKNVSELSKEELIKVIEVIEQEKKPKFYWIGFFLIVTIMLALLSYLENSYTYGGAVHFSTVSTLIVVWTGLYIVVLYRVFVDKKRLDALIELLRKSNVINS